MNTKRLKTVTVKKEILFFHLVPTRPHTAEDTGLKKLIKCTHHTTIIN